MLTLASHTRRFLWATIGIVVPLAVLLVLFPRLTGVHWMWAMRDPRSAILVGAVYVGASVYYWLAVQSDDWLQAQAGLEGVFTVSAVLLAAVVVHWDVVRPWHPVTLIWMPAYYVPLVLVPYLFRLEGGWRRVPGGDQAQISAGAARWLTLRGLAYAAGAVAGFAFAEPLSRAWPWAIDPVEVRMFMGQPATFVLAPLAIMRGNLLFRRHRLALIYLGSLGIVQIAALLALSTPYRWTSPLGVLLPAVFLEWVATALVVLASAGREARRRPSPAAAPVSDTKLPSRAAPQLGAMILGVAYLSIGLIGFVPVDALNPAPGGVTHLLRHIAVNGMHNVIHIVIGITGIAAARAAASTRVWGQTVGVVLMLLFGAGIVQAALTGFPTHQSLLGVVALNSAGHVFHFATGVVALVFGLAHAAEGILEPR